MITRHRMLCIATCCLPLLGGGCTSLEKQLYIASDTSLGVNGAVNTAQTAGKIVIGYDRKFVTVVPKMNPNAESDVMSAYNCTHVEIKGLRISKFRERLASGEAATNLVSNMRNGNAVADCGRSDP